MRYFVYLAFILCVLGFSNNSFAVGQLMDEFSGNELDSGKWRGRNADSEALEQVRELTNGVLDSRVRGPIDNHPSGMALNQLDIADPNSINTLEAKVKVNDAGLSGDVTMVSAGIEGFFYNEAGGSVWAGLQLAYNNTGYYIQYGVGTPGGFISGDLFSIQIAANTNYTLKIVYNNDKQFTFWVNGESHIINGVEPKTAVSSTEFKSLFTGIYGQTSGSGFIDAEFDDVVVNNAPYDDFQSATLDPTKWWGHEVVREIRDNQAQMNLGNLGNTYTQLDLKFNSDYITDYTQADVTVQSTSYYTGSSTHGQLRLIGTFYNTQFAGAPYDGEIGEVYASVVIKQYNDGSLASEASILECLDAPCYDLKWLLQENFSSCNIQPDVPVTISIRKDGPKLTLSCGDDTKSYTMTGTPYPSQMDFSTFRERVYSTGGETGYMSAKVDNVRIKGQFPWAAFLPPILSTSHE